MRAIQCLILAAAASFLAAAQTPSGVPSAGSAAVPVDQEPRHHLLFANESLRIISPQIPAGDTTLEHIHTHDDTTVCIHGSQMRNKPPGGEWGNPGMVCTPGAIGATEYTGKPRSHTVQNLGDGVYHLLLVENLRDGGWTSFPAVDIPGMKVLRENRSFRSYGLDGSGSAVAPHAHAVPTAVVLVSGEVMAGGKHLTEPGQWALIPAGEQHQVTAHGDARFVEIEVR